MVAVADHLPDGLVNITAFLRKQSIKLHLALTFIWLEHRVRVW